MDPPTSDLQPSDIDIPEYMFNTHYRTPEKGQGKGKSFTHPRKRRKQEETNDHEVTISMTETTMILDNPVKIYKEFDYDSDEYENELKKGFHNALVRALERANEEELIDILKCSKAVITLGVKLIKRQRPISPKSLFPIEESDDETVSSQ